MNRCMLNFSVVAKSMLSEPFKWKCINKIISQIKALISVHIDYINCQHMIQITYSKTNKLMKLSPGNR